MASSEPSEDEVAQVLDVTGLNPVHDRQLVIQSLKNNNRNLDTVITKFYDDPESFRRLNVNPTWDDSMFSADRDGTQNDSGISFHIEAPNQNDIIQGATPPPEYGRGAPSRPPSRTNNRSPLGNVLDWTADTAGISNSRSQEDDDMERALRESAQEAGIEMPAQESGVMSTSAPHFGPANRNDYDSNSWAMVPSGVQGSSLQKVAVPSARKRAADAPAFLLQGDTAGPGHTLGGLLTILHQIPLIRNGLITCGETAASYGHNGEWWRGQPILPPHVLARMESGGYFDGELESHIILEEELHRLMAFLDSTERSYATVKSLTKVIPHTATSGTEKALYEYLQDEHEIAGLFQKAIIEHISDAREPDVHELGTFEIDLLRNEYRQVKTLYEALDLVFWSQTVRAGEWDDDAYMLTLRDIGEVFSFAFSGGGPESSFDIPLEFYPERWLTCRKEETKRIQMALIETRATLDSLREEEERLFALEPPAKNPDSDKKTVLNRTKEQFQECIDYVESASRFRAMANSRFNREQYPTYQTAPVQMREDEEELHNTATKVVDWTGRYLRDLEERMQELRQDMDKIQQKQRFLGKLLTDPTKERPKPFTCKKYNLRGILVSADIIFVCRRSEPDLIALDNEPSAIDAWWKLSHDASAAESVKAEKMEVERVLSEVWELTKEPTLIYATDAALEAPRQPLDPALERFVQADNKAFRRELQQEATGSSEAGRELPEPMSPTKRKHRDSMDSLNSNMASIASDEAIGGFEDDSFVDHVDVPSVEMHEMGQVAGMAWGADSPAYHVRQDSPSTTAGDQDEGIPLTPESEPQPQEMQEKRRPSLLSATLSRRNTGQGDTVMTPTTANMVRNMELPGEE